MTQRSKSTIWDSNTSNDETDDRRRRSTSFQKEYMNNWDDVVPPEEDMGSTTFIDGAFVPSETKHLI